MDIFQIIGATISKVLLFLLESDSQGKNFQIFGDKIISTVGDGYLFWWHPAEFIRIKLFVDDVRKVFAKNFKFET